MMATSGRSWKLAGASWLTIGGAIASSVDCAFAQITPDATLGAESSVVTPLAPSSTVDVIQGGATRGANLFHSFKQFSVLTGREAHFNNALEIQNIISRVTGSSISNIDGLIRANGTANLFLLNPNGIIFGRNASLNLGGSFVATTANAIGFGNQGFFSADDANTPRLLTVNPSAFLFNQIAAGPIANQSVAGLQVSQGRSLLLLGGDVSLDGGVLQAAGGFVELGGVVGAGTVGLRVDDNNLGLSFPVGVQRADVFLTNGAEVNVNAGGAGSIGLNARNLDVLGGSGLRAGIGSGLGSVDSQAGDITLNATEAITITNSFIRNNVESGAIGNAGNLTIESGQLTVSGNGAAISTSTFGEGNGGNLAIITGSLSVSDGAIIVANVVSEAVGRGGDLTIETGLLSIRDGALVSANTEGVGDAGNLTVRASDLVEVVGTDEPGLVTSLESDVSLEAIGRGGNLTIETRRLSVRNAQVGTSTFGVGDVGDLTVHASDSVELTGEIPGGANGFPGGLFAQLDRTGVGRGGTLTIKTGRLSVSDGSKVQVATFGEGNAGQLLIRASEVDVFETPRFNFYSTGIFAGVQIDPRTIRAPRGNAGNLTIQTERLSIRDGGEVSASTSGEGNAGNLIVRARDSVEVVGTTAESGQSLLAANVYEGAIGTGGNLTIETGRLSIRDGAEVTVSSQGSGIAGELTVQARSIGLENQGAIAATTGSGNGGDITLQAQDLLLLRRESNISTRAGTEQTSGTGGSITIDTDNLVALENSDIDANAFGGPGGQVRINASGIFGTQGKELQTPESDITASSNLGPQFSGTVEINTPDVDPSRGLVSLPAELVEASGLIAQGCSTSEENEFIVTGRGGLPPNPGDVLSGEAVLENWATLEPRVENLSGTAPSTNLTRVSAPTVIVEAQGWVISSKGEVILTAQAPTVTPHIPWMTPAECHAPQHGVQP